MIVKVSEGIVGDASKLLEVHDKSHQRTLFDTTVQKLTSGKKV